MSRTRSNKVEEAANRLREMALQRSPGERFLSTREAAVQFGLSYQTAHRLLEEMSLSGLVERRAASGTYIPGQASPVMEARLLFNNRARRPQSFGDRLLTGLTQRLKRAGATWELRWAETASDLEENTFPILWEAPYSLEGCRRERRRALILNDRPRPGLDATLLDSVAIDDYFGGVCAAQLLIDKNSGSNANLVIIAGPDDDSRSLARRNGFLSLCPEARVIVAGGWYVEDGLKVAAAALGMPGTAQRSPKGDLNKFQRPDGLFCANDRLAEAVLNYCRDHSLPRPSIVGFDDAPIAFQLNLTTIALPWEELLDDAVAIVCRRLAGDNSAARQQIVTPHPMVRHL